MQQVKRSFEQYQKWLTILLLTLSADGYIDRERKSRSVLAYPITSCACNTKESGGMPTVEKIKVHEQT